MNVSISQAQLVLLRSILEEWISDKIEMLHDAPKIGLSRNSVIALYTGVINARLILRDVCGVTLADLNDLDYFLSPYN